MKDKRTFWYDPPAWDGVPSICIDERRCRYCANVLLRITKEGSDAHNVALDVLAAYNTYKVLHLDLTHALERHYRQWALGQHNKTHVKSKRKN